MRELGRVRRRQTQGLATDSRLSCKGPFRHPGFSCARLCGYGVRYAIEDRIEAIEVVGEMSPARS